MFGHGHKKYRLESIRLADVGPFEQCKLTFLPNKNPKLAEVHIFTGGNGCGKSTLLITLANFFSGNFSTELEPAASLADRAANSADIVSFFCHNGVSYRGVIEWRVYEGKEVEYVDLSRSISVQLNEFDRAYKPSSFGDFSDFSERMWKRETYPCLPLAYCGQRPLNWKSHTLENIGDITESPLKNNLNFVNSIEPRAIVQWIANITAKEALALKSGNKKKAQNWRISLNTVVSAINDITDSKISFDLDPDSLEVMIEKDGKQLSFDVLPDGLKSIISWIADVLMRMDRLPWENPDAPLLEQPLILFLDEIDIHLHPKWQRKVLPVVQKLFPNAQIFVSTHSPFVVGSVQDAWVYKLDDAKTKTVIEGIPSGAGTSYEVLLEEIFDVSEHYDVETQRLLTEMKTARNALLADKNAPTDAFKALAQTLAARSEELDGVVATELRQLAKHGVVVTLDPVAA